MWQTTKDYRHAFSKMHSHHIQLFMLQKCKITINKDCNINTCILKLNAESIKLVRE